MGGTPRLTMTPECLPNITPTCALACVVSKVRDSNAAPKKSRHLFFIFRASNDVSTQS